MRTVPLVATCLLGFAGVSVAALDEAAIQRGTGRKPETAGRVTKVVQPRTDLAATADGVRLVPFQGLTSWAAFQEAREGAMVMGDIVLQQHEVAPAMDAALQNGLEVTALHNHFFWEEPRIFFMHIGGHGLLDALAGAVGQVFQAVSAAKPRPAETTAAPAESSLEKAPLEAILGTEGQVSAGMVKFVYGRTATMHGTEIGSAMGVNTWAVFAGSPARAVVDGDFAMLEEELQPVLKALRGAGVVIVAIHHHMTHEEPRIVFLHYWGKGEATTLARAVRAALDAQKR